MENAGILSDEFIVQWQGPDGVQQGPLSLLWQLIESYKVDIFQVSIHKITEDFLYFLERAKELKIELASSFTVMAARLVYYKSLSLLPSATFVEEEKEYEELPEELVKQLLEFKKYQKAATLLEELQDECEGIFFRENQEVFIEQEEVYSINDLIKAYIQFLKKKKENSGSDPVYEVKTDKLTVEEKIESIRNILQKKNSINFLQLIENKQIFLWELLVTFLAILELVRLREIIIVQKEVFGPIFIYKVSVVVG